MSATHPPDVRRPAGWTPPSHRRALAMLAGIAVVAAVVALIAGWLAGDAVVSEPAPAGPTVQTAGLGAVTLAVPAAWAGADRIPEIRDLDRARTAAFAPSPGRDAYVIATLAPADHPTLVPEPLRRLLTGALPPPAATHLAGAPAWRYAKLPATNGRIADLTVAATTAGSLIVACVAAPEARSSVAGCDGEIRRATLSGAEWRPPAEVAGGLRLDAVIARLDSARVARREALRTAPTRAAQGRIAARLAGSYGRAATALGTGPVAAALRDGAQAYRRLAAAATAGRPARYAAAKRSVRAADAELARAIAAG